MKLNELLCISHFAICARVLVLFIFILWSSEIEGSETASMCIINTPWFKVIMHTEPY